MFKIFCLEDSEDTILMLENALCEHQILFARSLHQAKSMIKIDKFDLYIFDVVLPDGCGLEAVSFIPTELKDRPILFLTGKQDYATKLSAFTLGADDFIMKPFDTTDLQLRVNSRLQKRFRLSEQSNSIILGDLVISLNEQRLQVRGNSHSVDLTSIEFRILLLFARAPSRIFSRNEVLERVWTDHVSVIDRTVDVHVSKLRKKLIGSHVSIETVINSGYRLVLKPESRHPKTYEEEKQNQTKEL